MSAYWFSNSVAANCDIQNQRTSMRQELSRRTPEMLRVHFATCVMSDSWSSRVNFEDSGNLIAFRCADMVTRRMELSRAAGPASGKASFVKTRNILLFVVRRESEGVPLASDIRYGRHLRHLDVPSGARCSVDLGMMFPACRPPESFSEKMDDTEGTFD